MLCLLIHHLNGFFHILDGRAKNEASVKGIIACHDIFSEGGGSIALAAVGNRFQLDVQQCLHLAVALVLRIIERFAVFFVCANFTVAVGIPDEVIPQQ